MTDDLFANVELETPSNTDTAVKDIIMDEKFQKIDPHQPYCTCVSCQDYRLNKKASNNKTLFSKLKMIIFKIFFI